MPKEKQDEGYELSSNKLGHNYRSFDVDALLAFTANYKRLRKNSYRLVQNRALILDRELPELTQQAMEKFLLEKRLHGGKRGGPAAENTLNAYKTVWKYLIDWFNETERPHKLKTFIQNKDHDRQPGPVLSPDEVDRLLSTHVDYYPIHGFDVSKCNLNYGTFNALLFKCGLRFSDAAELNVSDVDLPNGLIRVIRTKSLQRPIYLTDSLIRDIGKLIEGKKSNDPIFTSAYGNRFCYTTYHADLRRRLKIADISKHITSHALRRSHATHLKRYAHRDVADIARSLGDKDLQTVNEHYLKYEDEDMREIQNSLPSRLKEMPVSKSLEYKLRQIEQILSLDDRISVSVSKSESGFRLIAVGK